MLLPNQNTGVQPIVFRPTDFSTAGITGLVLETRIDGNWVKYRSREERQAGVYFDSFACVSFSALNSVEEQINWMILNNKLSIVTYNKLVELGFIVNGLFEASDRFTAKMSGTTRIGNTGQAVWDSIRNHGLLPEKDWTWSPDVRNPVFDWDDFYAEIPQALKDKAKEILKLFTFNYEWVVINPSNKADVQAKIEQHIVHAPLQIFAPLCPTWNDGIVAACSLYEPQHATIIDAVLPTGYSDYDHYNPFSKTLAFDYPILFILKGVVNEVVPEKVKIPYLPYYERLEGQSGICAYDPDTDSLIAYESGRIFKAIHGGYSDKVRIKVVPKWSREIKEVFTTKPY